MKIERLLLRLALAVSVLGLAGCLKQGPPISLHKVTDDDDAGTNPRINPGVDFSDAAPEFGAIDPHALVGVNPSHGSWKGGQSRLVRGNGFSSLVRIWFGPNEVPTSDIIAIDPSRAQVVVPAGAAGPADVKTQIGNDASTARTLAGAYLYEDFYAEPDTGPTSGGTPVHLFGEATNWGAGTTVTIDDAPCEPVQVISATELACVAPKGTPGAKSINVTAPDKVSVVRDGFTYADSDNGFIAGLSGAKLGSQLKVLVYDNFTGQPLQGAFVLAGDDVAAGLSAKSDAAGVVVFSDPSLGPTRSVTVAAKCHQPITFIDVPVDTVTAFLTPVLSPACAAGGDPPSVGGRGIFVSTIRGELVWGQDGEFRTTAWRNVPNPVGADEARAAYVFRLSGDPTSPFFLPDPSTAARPELPGTIGSTFRFDTTLGNLTLYALAGIENRTAVPPTFTAYAMGIVRGVSAAPGETTDDIFIPIDIPLDHAVSIQAATPSPGPRGPDRAHISLAVEAEIGGFAILPAGGQDWLLPIGGVVSFVGLPPLSGALAGTRYVASAVAGTGPSLGAPLSQVGQFASTTESIALDTFVPVPVLDAPRFGGTWDGRQIAYRFAAAPATVDLTVLRIDSAGGLVSWLIAAPGGTRSLTLPDLGAAFPDGALVPGSVSIFVYGARMATFDYGSLRYRQLSPAGFDAYSLDVLPARLE